MRAVAAFHDWVDPGDGSRRCAPPDSSDQCIDSKMTPRKLGVILLSMERVTGIEPA